MDDYSHIRPDGPRAPGIAFLFLLVAFYVLADLLAVIAAAGNFPELPYVARLLIGASELALVSLIALYFYPNILTLSKWSLTISDVAVSIAALLFLRLLLAAFVRDFVMLSFWATICSVTLNPFIEEIFFRGILLRSLVEKVPKHRALAIFAVGIFAACLHSGFIASLVSQLVFSIVYLSRRNSIYSAIVCHCMNNLAIAILARWLVEHHHVLI